MIPEDEPEFDWNPLSPQNQWASACVNAVKERFGLTSLKEWHSRPQYTHYANMLNSLYGKGISITDIGPISRGEKPWPPK